MITFSPSNNMQHFIVNNDNATNNDNDSLINFITVLSRGFIICCKFHEDDFILQISGIDYSEFKEVNSLNQTTNYGNSAQSSQYNLTYVHSK